MCKLLVSSLFIKRVKPSYAHGFLSFLKGILSNRHSELLMNNGQRFACVIAV